MPRSKKLKREKEVEENKRELEELNKKIKELIQEIENIRNRHCLILWKSITPQLVEEIFEELRNSFKDINGELDIIIHSSGGDIDAAYNLACLFQKYGSKKLIFIIPRWAKSAATLIACAGDEILMTPIAELGPLDPQITQINPFEERFEQFSPLHIQVTLDLIRNEFEEGNKELAEGLLKRLQFPLTLGSFMKSQEIAEQYLIRLMKSRACNATKLGAEPKEIAKRLTKEYADHGFCINLDEAKRIGLNVKELDENLLQLVWQLFKLFKEKEMIKREIDKKRIEETIRNLPPEIFDKIRREKEQTEIVEVEGND